MPGPAKAFQQTCQCVCEKKGPKRRDFGSQNVHGQKRTNVTLDEPGVCLEWTGTRAPFHVASAPEKLCCSMVTLAQAQRYGDGDTRSLPEGECYLAVLKRVQVTTGINLLRSLPILTVISWFDSATRILF
jgi:hypothetical protein